MLNKLKLFLLLIITITLIGNNVDAEYEKLAYDFKFKENSPLINKCKEGLQNMFN